MDVMLGEDTSKSMTREFDSIIYGPGGHQDRQSLPNRESLSQKKEIRGIEKTNGSVSQEGLSESINILSDEMIARILRNGFDDGPNTTSDQ